MPEWQYVCLCGLNISPRHFFCIALNMTSNKHSRKDPLFEKKHFYFFVIKIISILADEKSVMNKV